MNASWRTLLTRIGERCAEYGGQSDAEDHIETCCTVVCRDLPYAADEILSMLMECAEELPHKAPLYGTLVGLINTEDEDFASKVVQKTHDGIQDALDCEDNNKIRVLIRFLTILMSSNVVSPRSLIGVFETLLSSAATTVDDEKGNPAWQPRADFYVYCILASLPWGGLELFERVPEELERVMAGVEAYLRIRRPIIDLALHAFSKNEDDAEKDNDADYLEDLWKRINDLQENGWKVESVPRPHLVFEARLATCQSCDFGQLTCLNPPEPPASTTMFAICKQRHEADRNYPQRMRRIRIFPRSKTDEDISLIDRFVVEEYLLDVLFYLNGCRKECAAYLAGLPVPFRYEYLMAEAIFSQLLLLPRPPFKEIYYAIVIIDLCKALPGAFPTVVARAVRSLFNRVGDLDVECRTRLIFWFAHHLSNFQFVWPWEEWADVMEQPRWSPERMFVQEVLEKEVRLSYLEKIKQTLDGVPELLKLLPPKGSPCFKYSAENHANYTDSEIALSTELTGMVKGKKTAREIWHWVEEKIFPSYGHKAAIEIVVQTLLYIGSKSFTHMCTVLERYHLVFSKLSSNQNYEITTIEEVAKMWQNNTQMAAIIIDRMMGCRIISNLAIINWVFSAQNVQKFHTSDYLWEILRNAINKTNNRTVDLKKEVTAAQEALKMARDATNRARLNLEAAQTVLDAATTDEAQTQATAKAEWAKSMVEKKMKEEISAEEGLEAKDILLSRALREQEALFVAVFAKFSALLIQIIPRDPSQPEVQEKDGDPIDIEEENPTPMDADDNDKNIKEHLDNEEKDQLRICILGQLRAIIRHYAAEVWEHIEKLETNMFNEGVHPIVMETARSCLWPTWS